MRSLGEGLLGYDPYYFIHEDLQAPARSALPDMPGLLPSLNPRRIPTVHVNGTSFPQLRLHIRSCDVTTVRRLQLLPKDVTDPYQYA